MKYQHEHKFSLGAEITITLMLIASIGFVTFYVFKKDLLKAFRPKPRVIEAFLQDGARIVCEKLYIEECGMTFAYCKNGITYYCQQNVRILYDR